MPETVYSLGRRGKTADAALAERVSREGVRVTAQTRGGGDV